MTNSKESHKLDVNVLNICNMYLLRVHIHILLKVILYLQQNHGNLKILQRVFLHSRNDEKYDSV